MERRNEGAARDRPTKAECARPPLPALAGRRSSRGRWMEDDRAAAIGTCCRRSAELAGVDSRMDGKAARRDQFQAAPLNCSVPSSLAGPQALINALEGQDQRPQLSATASIDKGRALRHGGRSGAAAQPLTKRAAWKSTKAMAAKVEGRIEEGDSCPRYFQKDDRPFVIGASGLAAHPAAGPRRRRRTAGIVRSNKFPNCSYFRNWTSADRGQDHLQRGGRSRPGR